jgi:hypothetical protein
MMCPSCLSIMFNKAVDSLEKIPLPGLLSFHCWNDTCPAREFGYQSHMKIDILPSKEWVCQAYHLPFYHKEKWFAMVGEPFQGFLGYPPNWSFVNGLIPDKQTTIYHISESTKYPPYLFGAAVANPRGVRGFVPATDKNGDIVSVAFIPISTDDSMHEQAQHLFNRLIKLAAFT